MSKFCENCGAEMDDNQVVCPNCGNGAEAEAAKVEETVTEATETTTTNTSSANSNNLKKYGIIAGIVAAVVIIIAIIASILGGGWKKPIDNYFKGMEKGNLKTYTKAFPDFYNDKVDLDDDDMEKLHDNLEDEYGEKIKITYKVTKKEDIKKDDLKKVQEYIEKVYDEDVKVSGGKEVKVKATIKGKDDEDTDTQKMYVYKINGKWKLLNGVSPDTAKTYLKNHKD
ncbi:MAG: zinc-ribbon domain-containing protein [Clostridia bacterium]|nr:zinc-ribbon domain-containing protein [Clostridia bacterium]